MATWSVSRRMEGLSSRSMATWAVEEYGKETGLPLVLCPTCRKERVLELVARTTENGNQGRVFFKCSRNVQGMSGRCAFYEFQKSYLKKLVELKYVSMDLEAGKRGLEECTAFGEEAQSKCATKVGAKNKMEQQIDALISLLKMLLVGLCGVCVVGILYVLK